MRSLLIFFMFQLLFQPIHGFELNTCNEQNFLIPPAPLDKTSPIFSLVEQLYTENNILSPSYGFISTANDIYKSVKYFQNSRDSSHAINSQPLPQCFNAKYLNNIQKNTTIYVYLSY